MMMKLAFDIHEVNGVVVDSQERTHATVSGSGGYISSSTEDHFAVFVKPDDGPIVRGIAESEAPFPVRPGDRVKLLFGSRGNRRVLLGIASANLEQRHTFRFEMTKVQPGCGVALASLVLLITGAVMILRGGENFLFALGGVALVGMMIYFYIGPMGRVRSRIKEYEARLRAPIT